MLKNLKYLSFGVALAALLVSCGGKDPKPYSGDRLDQNGYWYIGTVLKGEAHLGENEAVFEKAPVVIKDFNGFHGKLYFLGHENQSCREQELVVIYGDLSLDIKNPDGVDDGCGALLQISEFKLRLSKVKINNHPLFGFMERTQYDQQFKDTINSYNIQDSQFPRENFENQKGNVFSKQEKSVLLFRDFRLNWENFFLEKSVYFEMKTDKKKLTLEKGDVTCEVYKNARAYQSQRASLTILSYKRTKSYELASLPGYTGYAKFSVDAMSLVSYDDKELGNVALNGMLPHRIRNQVIIDLEDLDAPFRGVLSCRKPMFSPLIQPQDLEDIGLEIKPRIKRERATEEQVKFYAFCLARNDLFLLKYKLSCY